MIEGPLVEDLKWFKNILGLQRWNITLKSDASFDYTLGESAYIVKSDDERVATIYIEPFITDTRRVVFLMAHEMVHIVMADLEYIACNGRSTDIMDLFNRELERVVNDIAEVLVAARFAVTVALRT